jgi:hypothetical protein
MARKLLHYKVRYENAAQRIPDLMNIISDSDITEETRDDLFRQLIDCLNDIENAFYELYDRLELEHSNDEKTTQEKTQ